MRRTMVLGLLSAGLGGGACLVAYAAPSAAARIELVGRVVDTQAGAEGWSAMQIRQQAASLFAAIPQQPDAGGALPFLIQFAGTMSPAQRDAIEAGGGRFLGFIPKHACLVALDPLALERVGAVAGVNWVGEWRAAYKLEPALAALIAGPAASATASTAGVEVTIQVAAAAVADIADGVLKSGGTVLGTALDGPGGIVRARVPARFIGELAALGAVTWMERFLPPRLWNDVAAGGGSMNVTNVWLQHGLTGQGQIVGHTDTGLDIGSTNGIHPDFAGKIVYATGLSRGLLGRGGKWDDPDGHGTHTAGSILGSGAASGGQYRGVAFGARLVHQSVIDKLGLLTGIPTDLHDLFHEAYTNGARIHSDSWGAAVGGRYDTEAVQCDTYMWQHPDMLLVFAAGNDGIDADANGVIDLDSMGSPATAKNLLCVGATESGRQPGTGGYTSRTYGSAWGTDYPAAPISNDFISASPPGGGRGMAAYSSRGPTDDGRIKPDLVAPGTDIISARSRHPSASVEWGIVPGNTNYVFSGGTSMATPLTAGAATLVRQYFTDVAGLTNLPPSAALIKATLLNGARSLGVGQYGAGPAQELPTGARPNAISGWGAVDVEQSLFPSLPVQLRFVDWESVDTGETNRYQITVSATNRLTLTLAYSDYPGFAGGARALVNDLDLVLVSPSGVTNRPNGLSGADHLNNVEGIDVEAPAPGLYTVRIEGTDVPAGPQPYALVLRGAASMSGVNQRLGLGHVTYSVAESEGTAAVTVQRRGGVSGTVMAHLTTVAGTAQSPADFAGTNLTVIFGPGVVARTVNIPIVNDALDESDESFTVWISGATGALLGATTQAVVTIADEDGPGTIEFEAASYRVPEDVGSATVAVVRRYGTDGDVSVNYSTSNGTAEAGSDFSNTVGTLVFMSGEVRRLIPVPVLDDAGPEPDERFALRLSGVAGGAVLGPGSTAMVTIAANDLVVDVMSEDFEAGLPPGWSVVANADPSAVWRFDDPGQRGNLTGGSNGFAIADSDYSAGVDVDTELRTPPLDFSNFDSVSLECKLDFRYWFVAPDETGAVDLSTNGAAGPWLSLVSATGASMRGPRTVTLDISGAAGAPSAMLRFRYFNARSDWWCQIDDVRVRGHLRAGPSVQRARLSGDVIWAGESSGSVPVTVLRTGGTQGVVAVDFATAGGSAAPGVDYTPTNGTLVFADGESTASFHVDLVDDALTEPEHTILIGLSNPTSPLQLAVPVEAVIHIRDDDAVIVPRVREHFESGLPPGWAVLGSGEPAAVWRFDDPGGRTNQTGGGGGFAIADSAYFGPVNMETELRLPALDLTVFETVELVYRQDFNWYRFSEDEQADVEVSTQGMAGPWQLATRLSGAECRGPVMTNVDLTPLAAGQANVRVRFVYHHALGELWWQIDDVEVRGAVKGGNGDADGDGLQDWWEAIHYHGVTNAVPDGDDDGDGLSNGGEYVAGTDPWDALDTLRVDALAMPGAPTVVFESVSGRLYRLLVSTNLLDGWAPGGSVLGQGGAMTIGDDTPGRRRYYRLEVRPDP
ncbi:MAG: S8 family serine peptidase [Lentisphaerae bacterium]|nr:S8 family serine peptidase [Lentisphaerota bacterium]